MQLPGSVPALLRDTESTLLAPFNRDMPLVPLACGTVIAVVLLLQWHSIVKRVDLHKIEGEAE